MNNKLKNIISKVDHVLLKKFGSDKSTKILENIKEAQIIFSYLNEKGKESTVRFVGGCVRKALSGERISDIDLATSLTPNQVKTKLQNRNIKVIDTGISHGTLTLIINKKKFEITTLRKDVSTDGRHANVEFTQDWNEDSLRRDFTINAIYVDPEGRIFDPTNGVSDLNKGEIKFIGSAEERIQEDYLRILRYFRFFTQYSKIKHDQNIIKNIKQKINGLNIVSNERIYDELKKILSLKNVYKLFSNHDSKEIFLNIFPSFKYSERLKVIERPNNKIDNKFDHSLILAALILDNSKDYEYFCHKYKVSNITKNKFKNISENYEYLKGNKFYIEENIKKNIYLLGKDNVSDLLFFSFFVNKKNKEKDIQKLITYVDKCKIPKFPISGDYLKKFGYESGKILGEKLKLLEEKWIKNNFYIDDKMVEKSLRRK